MRLIALLLLASLLPAVSALPAEGGQPGVDANVLHVYLNDDYFWMSTSDDEPSAQGTGGFGTGSPATSWSWTVTYEPGLTYDMTLDEAGTIELVGWIGSTSAERAGVFDATMELKAGDDTILTGTSDTNTFANGEYVEVTVTGAPQVTTIPAGTPITWDITVDGAFQGIFLRHNDDDRPTRVVLPVTSTPPAPAVEPGLVFIDVVGHAFDENLTFAEPSDQATQYNWTLPAAKMLGFYAINGSGTLDIDVRQNGTSLGDWTTTDGGEGSFTFNGSAAPVRVFVNATGFQGDVRLVLEEDSVVTTQGPEGPDGADGGNETTSDGALDEDSPGLGLIATLLLVGLVVLARRD